MYIYYKGKYVRICVITFKYRYCSLIVTKYVSMLAIAGHMLRLNSAHSKLNQFIYTNIRVDVCVHTQLQMFFVFFVNEFYLLVLIFFTFSKFNRRLIHLLHS